MQVMPYPSTFYRRCHRPGLALTQPRRPLCLAHWLALRRGGKDHGKLKSRFYKLPAPTWSWRSEEGHRGEGGVSCGLMRKGLLHVYTWSCMHTHTLDNRRSMSEYMHTCVCVCTCVFIHTGSAGHDYAFVLQY